MKHFTREWIDPLPVEIPDSLCQVAGGNRFLAEALIRRGYYSLSEARIFINPGNYTPASPSDIPDLALAVDRIRLAIAKRELIGIWGDFDVDGQTATTVLVSGLRRLGADVIYHIPVRASESHGVNIPGLERMLGNKVRLVVTCDTGITAHESVDWANRHGLDIIITDHHTLPNELPRALAAVDPQRLPSGHPLFPLSGVGCAYKLVEELHRRAERLDEIEQDLDLVMMGTIADLAVLSGENRYIVWKGLQQIRKNQRPAINAILETASTKPDDLTEEQISFMLAPRLNALGRLGNANPVVEFFLSQDIEKARIFAYQLEGLNARRKLLCDQVFRAAQIQIENDPKILDQSVLVLNHPEWPAGVIGIVASRLVEQFHRPAVLISSPPGETARGSARSVEGINITGAISETGSFLTGFGGHPMAAGLGIIPEKIPLFRKELSYVVSRMVAEKPLTARLTIDAYVQFDQLTGEIIEALDLLSPFGPGNPPLVLASRNVKVTAIQTIGQGKEHQKITVEDERGNQKPVLRWNGSGLPVPDGCFDLAYTVRPVNFRGQNQLQITWMDERVYEGTAFSVPHPVPERKYVDLRDVQDPEEAFHRLEDFEEVIIWREGEPAQDYPGVGRHNLIPCSTLAIWNSPPGKSELEDILQKSGPQQIIFLALDSPSDNPAAFLTRLGGLTKHVIGARQGIVSLIELAAAVNQKENTVINGLQWLSAKGFIRISIDQDKLIQIASPGTADMDRLPDIEKELYRLLKETKAFRDYYQRVDPEKLLAT